MTQVARGLDPNGLLLLDVVVNGIVPESLADADLQVQVVSGSGASPGVCRWGGRERVGGPVPMPLTPTTVTHKQPSHFPSWTPSRG